MRATPTISTESLKDLSVVLPVWDSYVERFLPESLRALELEAHPARIILVDNASSVPLPDCDGHTVLRSPRRLTVGGARNLGLSAVQTPYVVFWDADDIVLPQALGQLRARLGNVPDAVAAVGTILEDTQKLHHWPHRLTKPLARLPPLYALLHCISGQFPTTGAVVMCTEKVRAAGGFEDSDGGDDWALGASLAFRGRVLFDDTPGRLYRQHEDSISRSWRAVPHLIDHAAAVRRRIGVDPAVPASLRLLAPLLAPLQLLTIFGFRPLRLVRDRLRARC